MILNIRLNSDLHVLVTADIADQVLGYLSSLLAVDYDFHSSLISAATASGLGSVKASIPGADLDNPQSANPTT